MKSSTQDTATNNGVVFKTKDQSEDKEDGARDLALRAGIAAGGAAGAAGASGAGGAGSAGGAGGAGSAGGASGSGGDKNKIGHRRVNEEGEVTYKKIYSNTLVGSIQLGLQHSIGLTTKSDERDLLMQDFMTVETHYFPRSGGLTPAHNFSDFKFTTCAPQAFRYFHNLFGIRKDDFMMSLCNEPLRELSNPGASGSLFFLTSDDEFIIKTVQHKEAEFLQKLLPGYYMNLNQNPHTLLPKFFGMYCYQCNQKNIRLTVMNNLLPTAVKMHLKFDLKGSTYKRKASKKERTKSSPTFKDLDFMEILPDGLLLEPETYNALITTMRRDCRVLESFRIMDYSLLVGIHNLDQAAKEEAEVGGATSPTRAQAQKRARERAKQFKQKLVAHSTAMESIQAQTEPIDEEEHLPPGGIPARNHKGERLLLYLGIIDILQSFRMRKKLEHAFKAIILDGDTVSVHRPGFYAHRFLDFMADKVFKKIPSPLKHSPSKKGKREMSMKRLSAVRAISQVSSDQGASPTVGVAASGQEDAAAIISTSLPGAANPGDYYDRRPLAGQKPDVVPGNSLDDVSQERREAPAGMSPAMGRKKKPSNRQHVAVKQQSVESLGTDQSYRGPVGHTDHGTPSRLSVGTAGSSGWNTPTPNTWTEGTPSFTPSSLSGASLGGVGQSSLDDVCDETLHLEA